MTDTDEEQETLEKCAHCGCEVDMEREGMGIQEDDGTWVDVCSSCYDEHVKTCQLCGRDDVMPREVSCYIVVKEELASGRLFPGIYRVLHYPFMIGSMLGDTSIVEYDVLFINRLPRPDRTFDISGHICKKCARNYHRQFKKAYPTKECRRSFGPVRYKAERDRVRQVAFAHPEMAMDLDCAPDDYDWLKKRRYYGLGNFKTYRDLPLLVNHRGVAVYAVYDDNSCWVSLSPLPDGGGPRQHIDASSLPDFKLPEKFSSFYDSYKPYVVAALKGAIDKGILTRSGLHDKTR